MLAKLKKIFCHFDRSGEISHGTNINLVRSLDRLGMTLGGIIILGGLFLYVQNSWAASTNVVINEVQVAGVTSKDEFIELHNTGSQDVSLAGWRLSRKTKSGTEYNLLTTFPDVLLPSGGFFLIVHPTDYSGSVESNATYSTSQSIAYNNTLVLYSDSGQTVVDLVGWGEAGQFEGEALANIEAGKSYWRTGLDTDNNANDFAVSDNPTPQSTLSLEAPTPDEPTTDPPTPEAPPSTEVSGDESEDTQVTDEPPVKKTAAQYSNTITITELLPNPIGTDTNGEYIELYNFGAQAVDLAGWQLVDASEKIYIFKEIDFVTTVLLPGNYMIIPRAITSLALNNTDGDMVMLFQPDGNLLEHVVYLETAKEGEAWAKDSRGRWQWTTEPTPGRANIFPEDTLVLENDSSETLAGQDNSQELTAQIIPDKNYAGLIIINEILPSPVGLDTEGEWVELFSQASTSVNLVGWRLDDAEGGSKPYKFPEGTKIEPTNYLVVERDESNIALNNTSDEVRLFGPSGTLVDSLQYENPPEGASFARGPEDDFFWTSAPTPGAANDLATSSSDIIQSGSTSDIVEVTLAQIRAAGLLTGGRVTVEGTVIVEPGILEDRIFYINGLQIYSFNRDFPLLELGDRVRVTGELSQNRGETRLKTKTATDIEIVGGGSPPIPIEVTLSDINESLEGRLVTVAAEITSKRGVNVYLADETGESRVYIKNKEIVDLGGVGKGDEIQVTGIVSETQAGYRLLPRYEEDVEVLSLGEELEGEVLGAAAFKETIEIPPRQNSRPNLVYYLLASIIALFVLLVGLTIKYRLHPKNFLGK